MAQPQQEGARPAGVPGVCQFPENGLMQRMTTEDAEEQEEIDGKDGNILDENNKCVMTEDMVNKIVTMVAANVMTGVEKIKEKLGGLEQ
eukprot:13501026-Heterocapsa_arctica.AAC.1